MFTIHPAVRALFVLILATLFVPPLSAQDTPSLEEMWRIIQQQQAEIDDLKRQNAELREQKAPAAEEAPAPEILATDVQDPENDEALAQRGTVMDIYGHAMLDMGCQNDPDWFDVVRPTKLPSYKGEFGNDGNFFSGVRQSRLGISTLTPTQLGDLKTIFEFELFGVVIVTNEGKVLQAGDVDYRFSIQSVSKPFTAALIMAQQGPEAVREKIGVEPTGLPFNS